MEYVPQEAILVLDSEDEQELETPASTLTPVLVLEFEAEQEPETRASGSSPMSTPTPAPTRSLTDVTAQSTSSDAPENASVDRQGPPRTTAPVSRDAWAPAGKASTPQSDGTVAAKDEAIDVVIKAEGQVDRFVRLSLTKSEDNDFNIFNVDGFDLGPPIEVDDKFKRSFTRKVIGDAHGGGHIESFHHWKPKLGEASKTPFLTFKRSWNNALPTSAGLHGIGFCDLNDSPVKPHPLNLFVGEGRNDWRLVGTYNYSRYGEIAPHHISLLPGPLPEEWIEGMLSTRGGKSWIKNTNADLEAARQVESTHDGVLKAFQDGRLRIPFTILQCVGYPEDWFEELLYYEKHPKPPQSKSKRKRRGPTTADSPRMLRNGKGKMREEPVSDSSDASEASDELDAFADDQTCNDDSEYEGPRAIAPLPTRTSPRKSKARQSPEL
ncbi:hypothetical protein B0H16DRAFT_309962 [Mycena metata]|uniref:DUF6697 domain-containing protein n=1 Tax=Mycena metata TaxID=1033252 RepID=A0AAD7NP15_9AGAR|nr:hypothetical protein B0H16DRAFT_309962 [Mycena metata]